MVTARIAGASRAAHSVCRDPLDLAASARLAAMYL